MAIFNRKKQTLAEQLSEARGRIAELEGTVTQGSTRDQLTGMLLTLRAFRAQLELDVERSHRYRRPLAIAVIDIDGFREINAKFGYETGDIVLVAVGELIAERSRTNDLACRISGDEFALLLPETEARDAVPALERTIAEIEKLETPAGTLGISGGIAMLQSDQSSGDLLSVARGALDRARAQGGGCVFAEIGEAETAGAESKSPAAGGPATPPQGQPIVSDTQPVDPSAGPAPPLAESAIDVARAVGVEETELGLLHRAALMRLGPSALPEDMVSYLNATNPDAIETLTGNPGQAAQHLRSAGGLDYEAAAIGGLGERWDGKGSPSGLAGESIPIAARILAVCEAYTSLTAGSDEAESLPRDQAVTEIARGSGSRFDPKVVDAFISHIFKRPRVS